MEARKRDCLSRNKLNGTFSDNEKFCQLLFDGISCWPATKAGQLATQQCPYPDLSSYSIITTMMQNASKKCEEDGTWYIDPELNRTWSNYSMCNMSMYDQETALINVDFNIDNSILYTTWLPIIKYVSHIGYWISLLTLILSVSIFSSIKKLQCARNVLHIHLFISFIMRAVMFIIKEFVLVEGVALKSDVVMDNGKLQYITEHYNWVCKAVTSMRFYFIQANYVFILMEGIYLHNLMFLNLFSDKSSIRAYYIFGWTIPLLFMGIWVTLRQLYEDTMCWTTSQNQYFSLLIKVPIEGSVLINFGLFLSITRVLCLKINSMYLQQRRIKYRRLIRSTLTLVLIYGVPCTISIAVSYYKNQTVEIIWIFCDQTFTAFQGLLMALIYCLLNGEVKKEVTHKYNSFRDKREQNRRNRTISNTQQFTFPLQDDPFVESPKTPWYKSSDV